MALCRQGPIACVGASVMDMISYVPRLPKLGETVLGSQFELIAVNRANLGEDAEH